MNCANFVCGTGGWTGPKPGDPDLGNVVLRATPGFGGINVSWTLPNKFPYAVAYTIVYRATSSSFSAAVEIGRVAGNRYLDPMELHDNGLYYYWIRLVSVHGTEGELVGPAECRMHSTIGQIIDDLSGQIREGVLHQSLLEKIDRIQLLGDGLLGESKAREQDILAVTRLVDSLSLEVDNMAAAIVTETDLRISSIDSLARQLTTLTAEFNDTKGIIQQEIGVLVSEQEALARAVTVAQVTADEANAAFRTEQAARIAADQALANSITTVESEMQGNLAQARQMLQTEIRTVDGKVTAIGARYTVQVQANGLAGGFGVYNDGRTVDAGFIANRFWIGSTAANKRKPFIVNGGVVYIDQAMIQNASITNAKIANGAITSAKIRDAAITNAKISNGSITTAKIGEAQVDRMRIAGNAVTTHSSLWQQTTKTGGVRSWIDYLTWGVPVAEVSRGFCTATVNFWCREDARNLLFSFRMLIGGTVVYDMPTPRVIFDEDGNYTIDGYNMWASWRWGTTYTVTIPTRVVDLYPGQLIRIQGYRNDWNSVGISMSASVDLLAAYR